MTPRLLPALDQTKQPPTPSSGDEWGTHGGGLTVLAKYSKALDVSIDDVRPERLKSVPSPWARLLLFEQALYERAHPAHRAVRAEWRGVMGAIGLARHLGLSLRVIPVDLVSASGVVESLRQMAPRDDADVWDRTALIHVGGQVIGGISSRTLVFSGIRPLPQSPIPFREDNRLTDPTSHYRRKGDRNSLALLDAWLRDFRNAIAVNQGEFARFLGHVSAGEGAQQISRVQQLLREVDDWMQETAAALQTVGNPPGAVVDSFEPSGVQIAFPSSHAAHAPFSRIRQVVPRQDLAQENDLKVAGSTRVALPGSGVLEKGGVAYTGDIALPKGMSASIKNGRFSSPPTAEIVGATLPDLSTFFESKLIPVRDVSPRAHALECSGVRYLLPVNPRILEHISPDDLIAWTRITGQAATGIRVRLEIPVGSGLTLVHERKYDGPDVLDAGEVDVPAAYVWPDFQSEEWSRYFWFTREAVAGALELVPVGATSVPGLQSGARWGELSHAPRAWAARYKAVTGVLPMRSDKSVQALGIEWDVSIDFGSTHTRVFKKTKAAAGPPIVSEVQLRPRARAILGGDPSLPYYFFVDQQTIRGSDAEAQSLIWLPLEMMPADAGQQYRPVDGVIYWDTLDKAPPGSRGLRGNLKWHGEERQEKQAFHSYLAQLFLAVSAEAAADGARIRSLVTAYPSVLPLRLRHRHRMEWLGLQQQFGVHVKPPMSESDALAAFLVEQQGASIASNLIAVDIGGSTSDVSIWVNGERVHSDSVRLAGDLLSRVVAKDAKVRAAITKALGLAPFNNVTIPWEEHDQTKNALLFNSALRMLSQESAIPDPMSALAGNLNDGSGSAGERALSYLGYLFATVSFLLGLMARRTTGRPDHFEMRFAGKGSGFLRWLEALGTGAGESIVSTFFLAGRGNGGDITLDIHGPGSMAKQEVGRGLLGDKLPFAPGPDDRTTFVGETGFLGNRGGLEWTAPLTAETLRELRKPDAPTELHELKMLHAFIGTFQANATTRRVAAALGISGAALTPTLRNRIHDALFGPQGMWQRARSEDQATGDALIEPIFVVEAKTLLASVTNHHDLFR